MRRAYQTHERDGSSLSELDHLLQKGDPAANDRTLLPERSLRIDREGAMTSKRSNCGVGETPFVAGNGLVDRRALLGRGILFAGAMSTGVGTSLTSAAAEPLPIDPWS